MSRKIPGFRSPVPRISRRCIAFRPTGEFNCRSWDHRIVVAWSPIPRHGGARLPLEGAHLILFWLALVAYGAEAGFRLAGVAPASSWRSPLFAGVLLHAAFLGMRVGPLGSRADGGAVRVAHRILLQLRRRRADPVPVGGNGGGVETARFSYCFRRPGRR